MKTTAIILISLISLLSGCSTIEGAGKDLQGAGQAISNEANRAKN